MTTTTTRATTTTTGASTQSSALISEQILAFKRFTEASSASALSELIASTSTSKSSSRSQSRSDVVLISDQDWSTMTAQTTNDDNNNHPSMIDLIVEQFLKSSEEFLIKESLEKMKLMFYTQCTLKEGDEEEEESFGKQIANMLNKSELDDLDNKIDLASLMTPLNDAESILDSSNVKVIVDRESFAIYFSRSPIPFNRDLEDSLNYFKHIGVYAFRKKALIDFSKQEVTPLEAAEKIECIRYLEYGKRIKMVETQVFNFGIDTPADLKKAKAFLKK